MKKIIACIGLMLCVVLTGNGWAQGTEAKDNPIYVLKTTLGNIEIELFRKDAPQTALRATRSTMSLNFIVESVHVRGGEYSGAALDTLSFYALQ